MGTDSPPAPLAILYEDRHCLIVAKPARLLTASDKTGDQTLFALARAYHLGRQADGKKGYFAPLHFLDRPVSGVVMFALSSKAAARLSAQLRERRVDKVYLAIVEGAPLGPAGVLEDWLLKDHQANVVTAVAQGTPEAKKSRLAYRLLARRGGLSLLEIRPETGRSHQIRVQLASRGMPIYGDRKYGASVSCGGQIALHARAVTFEHPVQRTPVTVTAPLPANWDEIWPRITDVQEAEADA